MILLSGRRRRHRLRTGETQHEVAYGITSLSPDQADAERWIGETNIAAATRHFAAQPEAAMRLIGVEL